MELMERVGLSNRISHRPGELSGGEQQRVAIARALIHNPKVLLADELTGNLDTDTRDSIMELLDELNRQGLAIVVATHDQEVMAHAKRRIRLRDGAIISPLKCNEYFVVYICKSAIQPPKIRQLQYTGRKYKTNREYIIYIVKNIQNIQNYRRRIYG